MLNITEIKEIIKLVDDSGIDEFIYETNGSKIQMKKSLTHNQQYALETAQPQPMTGRTAEVSQPEITTVEEAVAVTSEATKAEKRPDYDYEIKSPMVGTFYRASSPETDPFVELGQTVNNNSVVCIVEAMKLFNEIEAEVSGEIVEILVEDSVLVEYGQPLFRVKKK